MCRMRSATDESTPAHRHPFPAREQRHLSPKGLPCSEQISILARIDMGSLKQYSDRHANATVAAARCYRDAMWRYRAEQVAAQAEERLFALLDALDDP
jgi:hypothetical protein